MIVKSGSEIINQFMPEIVKQISYSLKGNKLQAQSALLETLTTLINQKHDSLIEYSDLIFETCKDKLKSDNTPQLLKTTIDAIKALAEVI